MTKTEEVKIHGIPLDNLSKIIKKEKK